MPRGGARPGSGRPKGTPDRKTMLAEAIAAGKPPQWAEFDAYEQLCVLAKRAINEVVAVQHGDKKELGVAMDRAARILAELVPYKHARLASVRVGGDPDNPIRTVTQLDLSKLTDEQLATLEAILPGGPSASDPPGEGTTTH